MSRQFRCDWCGSAVTDNVSTNDHSVGSAEQEIRVDDIPTLCNRCNDKAKD